MQVTQKLYYSPEEYLALEEKADFRSEYIDGEIIPIAGSSINHNQITLNFSTELNFAFKKENIQVYMSDVRLWIPKRRFYTYPDVMIITGEAEFFDNRTDMITNPQVIIEVLSKSTQGYDREDKFKSYRTIDSFQEYILIDQTEIRVEQYSKTSNKKWSFSEYDAEDAVISLVSVNFEISVQDLYNKVKFEPVELDNNETDI
jgi:Uma2 family endonuclease